MRLTQALLFRVLDRFDEIDARLSVYLNLTRSLSLSANLSVDDRHCPSGDPFRTTKGRHPTPKVQLLGQLTTVAVQMDAILRVSIRLSRHDGIR